MTVIARRIVAEPVRTASETWKTIADLLVSESGNAAREELLSVIGVASSLIAAEAAKDSPFVVHGSGPQVRIYCLYGEEAILGDKANESNLIVNPLAGDWAMSLPCPGDDLNWVQSALKKHSKRITARDINATVNDDEVNANDKSADINMEAFLRK